MKKLFALIALFTLPFISEAQTTVTVDGSYNINVPKLVAQTTAGQSFFTGYQVGSTYSYGDGIFRAITDNPNGASNIYYDGITNGVRNFFVTAGGAGYFAGNVGIGTTSPGARLEVSGNVILSGSGYYRAGSNNWFGSANALINGTAATTDLGLRTDGNTIFMKSGGYESARFDANGNLAIGTPDAQGYKLAVNGTAIATEMFVKLHGDWPDFVFKPTYKLPKLSEVKTYIDANQHLPDMPSEAEITDKGINLGEMNKVLVKKVEELTLYLIEQDKEKNQLAEKLQSQQRQIDKLTSLLQPTKQ